MILLMECLEMLPLSIATNPHTDHSQMDIWERPFLDVLAILVSMKHVWISILRAVVVLLHSRVSAFGVVEALHQL